MKIEIISNMDRYIREILEPKQEAFGALPPCPFARAERVTKKIRYELSEILPGKPTIEVISLIREFKADPEHSTLLVIDPIRHLDRDQAITYGTDISEQLNDIGMIAICLHPDDPFEIAGFRTRSPIPYVTIVAQACDFLRKAKKTLESTEYYRNWTAADLASNSHQIGRFLEGAVVEANK
jgi:hypothetical protein